MLPSHSQVGVLGVRGSQSTACLILGKTAVAASKDSGMGAGAGGGDI